MKLLGDIFAKRCNEGSKVIRSSTFDLPNHLGDELGLLSYKQLNRIGATVSFHLS